MRSILRSLFSLVILFAANFSFSQSCVPTNLNGTVINLPCGVNCGQIKYKVPHLKSTDDYTVSSIAYNPNAYTTSAPALTLSCANQDDKFFDTTLLPFKFCFFGQVYSKMVISTNGLVTFDTTNVLRGSHWSYSTTSQLPFSGTGTTTAYNTCATPTGTLFPRASIMGVYHDIDIDRPSVNKKMEYRVEGTAPCRRAIISFNEIPMFSCNSSLATHQIVIYESTGVVEVYIKDKPLCSSWNGGLAILGIQNWNRDKAVTAPGKNATQWSEQNTAYRFTPSGGTSRFLKAELYNFSGTLIHTTTSADTTTTTAGMLDINFPTNLCPAGNQEQYIVKTYFSSCEDGGAPLVSSDTVTIKKTASLNATATSTPANCAPNGTITVNVPTGVGTAPFTASLDGGAPQTIAGSSYTFTAVNGGAHTINISDASGCFQTINVTVVNNTTLNVTSSTTPAACPGSASGTITLSPQNGTAPYQYQLNSGPWQSSNVITGVPSGTHNVTIKDATGCQRTIQVTVGAGAGISASFTSNPTSCAGANNGSITISAAGGTGPYTYNINSGPYQTSNTFSNLAPGTYFFNVIDASGCQVLNQMAWVSAGGALTATAAGSATSCAGVNNGSITVTPTSGSGPYQYSLNGGAYQTSNTFNGLASGNYTVTVRDGAGCVSNAISVTVSQGAGVLATTGATPTSCNGASDGQILVSPNNGTSPYLYQLNGGAFQTSNIFTGLATGNYTIVVRDAMGCSSGTLDVTVPAGVTINGTAASTMVSCNGLSDGTITVSLTLDLSQMLSLSPFTYSLNGGAFQNSNVFNGIGAGNYTIIARSRQGCLSAAIPVTVVEPPDLAASASKQDVKCFGGNDGVITVSASGGTAPYQYSLNGTTYQASNSFTVAAGIYTVYVKDNNGCVKTSSVTVTEPTLLTATSGSTNASCDGGADGKITVTPNGGTSPYQYSIDGTTYQASNQFNVNPGPYTVSVKDANGCITTNNITVGMTNNLRLTPLNDEIMCESDSVQLFAQSNATSYSWTSANTLTNGAVANPVAFPRDTTQYVVTATLGRCSATDTVMVYVHAAPIPDAGIDGDICFGQTYTLRGNGGVYYSWTPSAYLSLATDQNPVVTPDKTTDYFLHVVDANGCKSLQPDKVTVNVTPPIVVRLIKDTIVAQGDVFMLNATSIATNYSWSPIIGLSDPNINNPMVTVDKDITYTVTATTSAGCKGSASVTLKVYKGPELYVPTAFTPNNDGKNDKFFPFPVGVKAVTYFRVYNRWGNLVFSSSKMFDGWDGKVDGVEQPGGVYVWMAEGLTKDNKKITKKGTITLIR